MQKIDHLLPHYGSQYQILNYIHLNDGRLLHTPNNPNCISYMIIPQIKKIIDFHIVMYTIIPESFNVKGETTECVKNQLLMN
jgi:hypothetical protein